MSSGSNSLQNPFESSDPVLVPSRFYGHRMNIQKIYARIGASRPQSISIVGERKIGKSSLLNTLSHQDTKSQFLPEPEKYIFGHLHLRYRNDWKPDEFFRCGLLWERKKSLGKLNGTDLQEMELSFQEYAKDLLENIWSLFNEKEQAVCLQLLTADEMDRSQMYIIRELIRADTPMRTMAAIPFLGKHLSDSWQQKQD